MHIDIGKPWIIYSDGFDDNIGHFDKLPDVSHISLCTDIPGLYWSIIGGQVYLGGKLCAAIERYAYEFGGSEVSMHSFQVSVSPSILYFFDKNITGPFLNAGIGAAYTHFTNSSHIHDSGRIGLTMDTGAGWAFPLGGLRLTLGLGFHRTYFNEILCGYYCLKAGIIL